MITLDQLTPAAEEGWWTIFELAQADSDNWILVGGQMMSLLGAEMGFADRVRPTADVDVVVNLRTRPYGAQWMAAWLRERGFEFAGANFDGVGHRFVRAASNGPGNTIVDVLACEGLGERTNTQTVPPARTVQAPGTVQAFHRSELVEVAGQLWTPKGGVAGWRHSSSSSRIDAKSEAEQQVAFRRSTAR